MIQKTLGIDLGTSSIGIAVRNIDLGGSISNQLEYYNSIIFKSGVGNGKSGEYSYAAERTKFRSTRRLYQARKYRIWATLRLLISYECCPLSEKEIDHWARYDKAKGLKRQYPVDSTEFEQWVRLDFDCDGIPEYSSPYQLRAELTERQLDWNNQTDRYKFGRAMYHIAQRRGFKSSKGETLKDAKENEDISTLDIGAEMKKSEVKKSKGLDDYMKMHNLPTIGCAFYKMECEGIRVRDNNEYQAVQSQYQAEVKNICEYQHLDKNNPALYLGLISTKKGEGTIFYRRPLRSQKGNVGKCTLEPNHRRCPASHPDFEEFRALSFINNIKYRLDPNNEWRPLSLDEKTELFEKIFTRSKATFKFEDIRKWIETRHNGITLSYDNRTINFRDHTTVAECPVISRIRKILGDDWHSSSIRTEKTRVNHHTGEVHPISYNYEDIWHLAYSSDDYEQLAEFAKAQMHLDDKQVGEMTRLWSAIQEDYASLSLKAIRNILPLLREGFIYNEAVALAKITDIIGRERWNEYKGTILSEYKTLSTNTNYLRLSYNIANSLIANYKSKTIDEQQGFRNTQYILDDIDRNDIVKCIINTLSEKRWSHLSNEEQADLQRKVEELYQQFFASSERDYYKVPRISDSLKQCLAALFPDIKKEEWNRLYHHSQIDKFPQHLDTDGNLRLGTPDIGSIKNPVAMRALHTLRRTINSLLEQNIIDETTRVVVETARDLNDANWRWAIESYQKTHEQENKAIADIIKEFRPNYTDADIEKGRLLFEQNIVAATTRQEKEKAERFALDMQKYKLWKEQNFQCLYSGKPINVSDLFNDNIIQIEHTVPRSISFDNSLTNKTVCFTQANRDKNNRIPSELPNYADIQDRIRPWKERVVHIKSQIELWKGKARTATTIERKNECIRQKHLWELELDYWQAKVHTFNLHKDEVDQGFRNSQLVDTRIITKYAFHYLKSVFSRVDVEKGSVTADFRKIVGIQSADEKKDRSKHSHHAIDAAVLTMIPVAAQRDRMIELFYQCEEAKGWEKDLLQDKLNKEIDSCHLGTINGLVETIENNILINHISKDQTLSPAKKPRYINNKRQEGQWNQGDSIRGSLHKDTFYGVIKSSDDEMLMVIRKPLKSLSEKDMDTIVDSALKDCIQSQIAHIMTTENLSFAKAIEKDIYMLNKDGQQIKSDKNGRPIAPIRHVRCYAKAGRGFLKKDTALQIKQQTYPSKQEYKNSYYAQNDDNYLCLFYDGMSRGKQKKEFRLINYFEIAQLGISTPDKLFYEPEFAFFEGNKSMHLKAIIRKGTRLLLYTNYPEEVLDMDKGQLSKRLYIVYKFNAMGTPNIYLRHHLEARKETDCSASETSTNFSPDNPSSYLCLKASNFQALIEGYHFEVDALGIITFK